MGVIGKAIERHQISFRRAAEDERFVADYAVAPKLSYP